MPLPVIKWVSFVALGWSFTGCARASLDRYQSSFHQPWSCNSRFRASIPEDSTFGSVRGHIKGTLSREKSSIEVLLRDPLLHPVAKIRFKGTQRNIVSKLSAGELENVLVYFPENSWWKWMSFLLGIPQTDQDDDIQSNSFQEPVYFRAHPAVFRCKYPRSSSRHPESCTVESQGKTLQIDFTFVDCHPRLH